MATANTPEFKVDIVEKEPFEVKLTTIDVVKQLPEVLNNFSAITAPTVNDDNVAGYAVGSTWIDTVTDKFYVCVDTTVGAAIWRQTDLTTHEALYNHVLLHLHSNKSILDNIQEALTSALKTAYDNAVTKTHEHANKATLDLIEEAFTSALKTAYDSCVTNEHTHTNKATLDLIEQALTSALKTAYDDAVTKKHTHSNKTELDKVTDGDHDVTSSGNPHSVTKSEIGLSNVTNNEQIPLAQKAVANGVATLGADSKIPTAQLPDLSITDIHTAVSEVAQLALSVQKGDVCVRSDENKSYIALNSDNADMGDWQELLTPTDSVTSVNGNTGVVVLTTSNIAEGTNKYYIEARVSANLDVLANTTARHSQNSDTDLDATFEATFVKKVDTINVLSDITSAGADIESAVTLKHAESHNIASHSDTTATGTQLNTLVGGGDTSLHKHDTYALDTDLSTHASDTTAIHGITDTSDLALKSGNVNQLNDITSTGANIEDAVTKKHSQNTDTALGTMASDVNMNTHKLTGLSVPSSNGDSIRATTKITEVNLESVIDNDHVAVTVAGAPLTLSTQEITFNYDTDDFALDGNNLSLKADGIKDVHIDWGTGANQVNSDDIPNYNGHTIYDTFCHILNRGIAEAVTVTLTGGLGISWTTGELFDPPNCLFIATDSGSGNVTDNTVNYLKWVSGTALTLSTTIATGNEILVATISVYDGVINGYREVILMDSNISNTRRALRESFPTRVINGMSVYEDTDVTNALDVTMDTGVFYKDGIERKTPVEIKSRNTAMVRHYHTTGTWDYDTNAEIDMANYDNPGKAGGQGLEALPSNKWVKSYFIFMNGKIGWIYPTEYFNTQGQAIAASLPAIPTGLTPLPKLTAIVYNSNHTTFTNTTWQDIRAGISEETFNLVTDHGSLAGLADDDHTQYILVDGTRAFTGNVDIGANTLTVNSIEIIGVDGEVNKAAIEDSGDWDTAYTHSQLTSGNPHSVTPTELSLVIGTNVQAYDNALASISGLAYVSDSFIKLTAEDVYAVRTIAEVKTDLSLNNVSNVATDDTAYNATSWDGNTDAATKNVIRDKIETMDTAIGLNTAKNTNVSTTLEAGTVNATTYGITSDGGVDDIVLPEADTTNAGLLGADKWDEIVANTAAKHTQGTDTTLGAMTADLNMSTHKITGVVDPVSNQEAATKKYTDDSIADLNNERNILNIIQNAFNIAVEGSYSKYNMVDSAIDAFVDETGVDTGTSTNEDYDSVNDLYEPISVVLKELDYMEYATDGAAQAGYVSSDSAVSEINRTDGTAIGDMTGGGGLAASFDGNTDQALAVSSISPANAALGYIGKDWGVGVSHIITRYTVYSTNDKGFTYYDGDITLTLQGSTDNFSSSIVNLHTDTFADATSAIKNYTSGITITTAYRYHRVKIECAADEAYCAEVKFYIPSLQCYSESTIKQQGTYSLKGVAAITDSLNDTLTRTVSPTIDLSNVDALVFDARASRTDTNFEIQIHDSGGTTTTKTVNIASADTWQEVSWDISAVTNANKDAIDSIIIKITNADAANIIYIDDFKSVAVTNNMTLVSNSIEAETQPDNIRIIINETDTDAITINTDYKAYASRDNGANWVQATLTDEGDYGSERIFTGVADVSAQAADKTIKYKITTLNNKDCKTNKIGMIWD